MKLNKDIQDETLNRLYKPISNKLNKIIDNTKKIDIPSPTIDNIKKIDILKPSDDNKGLIPIEKIKQSSSPTTSTATTTTTTTKAVPKFQTPVQFIPTIDVASSSPSDSENAVDDDDDDEIENLANSDSFQYYMEQYPPLARQYIERFFSDKASIDQTYGLNYDSRTSTWTMGAAKIDFDKDSNIIADQKHTFLGTPGLYDLVFLKKSGSSYTPDDLKNYRKLVLYTNSHRINNDPNQRVKGSKYDKYKKIIKPFSQVSGKGLRRRRRRPQRQPADSNMIFNTKPIEYVYWNNYNELVDRLRLLTSSKMAGNNSHDNEIASIIEELKEDGVIK
jgi:hypothetical protein